MKSLMYGPNLGCPISQWYNLSELFRNSHDASSRNGVVGRTGTKIPIIPRPNEINPNRATNFFILQRYEKPLENCSCPCGFCKVVEIELFIGRRCPWRISLVADGIL